MRSIFSKHTLSSAAVLAGIVVLSIALAGCGARSSDSRTPAGTGSGAAPAEPLISAPKHPGAINIAMSQAYLNRGAQLMDAEAFAAAVQSFSDALVADPGNAMIYYLRASAQLRRQNMQEAIADLSMAIRAGGKPTYLLSRCGAYFVTGAWHAAIADCTDTIQMAPMGSPCCSATTASAQAPRIEKASCRARVSSIRRGSSMTME